MRGYSVGSMGGYSVLILLIIFLGLPNAWVGPLAIFMIFLANFMNHPHFIVSYILFFEIYPKIKNGEFKKSFIARWWLAAVAIPAVLLTLLLVGGFKAIRGDSFMLKLSILLYGVSVGWHYVKQGFGMAMSEASIKKCYWEKGTRQWMLLNAYACWLFSICLLFSANAGVAFFGWHLLLDQSIFQDLLVPVGTFFFITTAITAISIYRNMKYWKESGRLYADWPIAGLAGYVVSIYLWVAAGAIFPLLMLVIPFFHSMQYLHVVERVYEGDLSENIFRSKLRRWTFLISAGVFFFWIAPGIFDYIILGRINIVSQIGVLFTACFWLFINIHHYFIDNVIWRRENGYLWKRLRGE